MTPLIATSSRKPLPKAPAAPAPALAPAASRAPGASVDLRTAWIVAIVAIAAGAAAMSHAMIGSYYDDGTYAVLAKSLATGQGYRHLNLPGTPVATHFPPGYPVFLAVLWWIWPDFPANTLLFKLANVALLGAVAAATYLLARRATSLRPPVAAVVALLGTCSPAMLVLSDALMSEMLWLALLVPALVVAERLASEPARGSRLLALGALLGVVMMVRTIALPAVVAMVLVLAVRRRWRDAALVAAGAAAFMLPWAAWTRMHATAVIPEMMSNYGPYGGWVGQALRDRGSDFLVGVVRRNVLAHAMYLGDRFMPFAGRLPSQVALIAFAGLMAAGAWALRRRAPVTVLTLFGTMAMLLAWPFQPDRFYYSLEPLIAVVAAAGVAFGVASWRRGGGPARVAAGAIAVAALLLVTGYGRDAWWGIRDRRWAVVQEARQEAVAPLVAWISRRTPPTAVVAVDADPMIYLYSGRKTVPLMVYRAEYYLRDPGLASAFVRADTRALLAAYHPNFLVMRGPIAKDGSAVRAAVADVRAMIRPVAAFRDSGQVYLARWPGVRPKAGAQAPARTPAPAVSVPPVGARPGKGDS